MEQRRREPLPTAKTAIVFGGNTTLAIWKDAAFARLFGGANAAATVPPPAYAAWAARDVVGMAVIFTLPPLVAPHLAKATGLDDRRAESVAQFVLPLAARRPSGTRSGGRPVF